MEETYKDLVILLKEHQQQAAVREEKLADLLKQALDGASNQQGQPQNASPRVHPVNTSKTPTLVAGATLAEFYSWREAWEDFSLCQQLHSQDKATRLATLRQCLDEDLKRYIRQGIIQTSENHDAKDLIASLEAYIRKQRNTLLDRLEFYNLRQDAGESFDEFYATLKELYHMSAFENESFCDECERKIQSCARCQQLPACRQQEGLRDRIVTGIANDETRHRLLAEPDLTLVKAAHICKSEEGARATQRDISGEQAMGHINAFRKSRYKKARAEVGKKPAEKQSQIPQDSCKQCGYADHNGGRCPASTRQCARCGETGHFAKVCSKREADKKPSLGRIQIQRVSKQQPDTVDVTVDPIGMGRSRQISWYPDTGSDVDAVNRSTMEELGVAIGELQPDDINVTSATGEPLPSLGKLPAVLRSHGQEATTEIHVYEELIGALMSKRTLKDLQYLPREWPALASLTRDTAKPVDPATRETKTGTSETQPNTVSPMPDTAALADRTSCEETKELLMKEFADVFRPGDLPPMEGPPVEIRLKPDAKPFQVHTPRTIPYAYRQQVRDQLDEMVREGVIETVTEPSEWCHPIVIVPKKTPGEVRLTVDLTKLNKQVERPVHPTRSVRDTISNIEGAKYYSTFDARHGYWQVPLAETSRYLTTFITPWGRYRYLRNPQGFVSAGDEYNQRMDAAFDGIANFGKVVDDCIAHDNELDSHCEHVREILTRARKRGITFSPKKFNFCQPEVQFCGYVISQTGWKIDSDKIKAIEEFPVPQDQTDVRSFMGLINQFSEFTPKIAELAIPLRDLLKGSSAFLWDTAQSQAFDAIRQELCKAPALSFYQSGAPTRLETDASRTKGLGFALLQHQDGDWKLIQCGSRFLSEAESRYAMIELECLAIVWAARKCNTFLAGSEFTVITDHKPLIPILNWYTLNQIDNPRLLRLVMKLQWYRFAAEWRKGKEHYLADALSRAPVDQPAKEDYEMEAELSSGPAVAATMKSLTEMNASPDLKTTQLRKEAATDTEYQELMKYVHEGFPEDQRALPATLHPYWNVRDQLTIDGDLVLKGTQIVIPRGLRKTALADLHASHQGRDRTQRRARQTVYWPGISNDTSNVVRTCEKCSERQDSQTKEPLMTEPLPKLPFQSVSADMFTCQGQQYLVYSDRLSGWPCIEHIGHSASSTDVIKPIRKWFSELGVPQRLTTDGGPQFSSRRFSQFCERWQVQHERSTPHYPQANGHAESAVKAVKTLIYKTTLNGNLDVDSFQRGLLEWRNTPRPGGRSPAQAVFGRPLASFLFANHRTFAPEYQAAADEADKVAADLRTASKSHYDQTSKPLRPLKIGTRVCVQDPTTKRWSMVGVIVAVGQRRDYFVKVPSGRVYWRNRRFLRAYHVPVPRFSPEAEVNTCSRHVPTENAAESRKPPLRRSVRQRTAPNRLNVSSTSGKSYD